MEADLSGPCSCVECHGLGTVLGCESCGVVKKPCHVCQQALLGCKDVKGKFFFFLQGNHVVIVVIVFGNGMEVGRVIDHIIYI